MDGASFLRARAAMLSILLLGMLLCVWHLATLSPRAVPVAAAPALSAEQIEYAKLMGKDPTAGAAAGLRRRAASRRWRRWAR